MTKTQEATLRRLIKRDGALAVAQRAKMAELTLLRALVESKGVHPGSLALLDRFAAEVEK